MVTISLFCVQIFGEFSFSGKNEEIQVCRGEGLFPMSHVGKTCPSNEGLLILNPAFFPLLITMQFTRLSTEYRPCPVAPCGSALHFTPVGKPRSSFTVVLSSPSSGEQRQSKSSAPDSESDQAAAWATCTQTRDVPELHSGAPKAQTLPASVSKIQFKIKTET